jgi:hypothetical protein
MRISRAPERGPATRSVPVRVAGLAVGAALTGSLALAACGSSGGTASGPASTGPASTGSASTGPASTASAQALAARMKTAVEQAASTHLTGRLTSDGRAVALNVAVVRAGGLDGTISRGGAPLHLISTGGRVYVQATRAFIRQLGAPQAICTIMCGKYVQLSGSQGRALAGSLSMATLTRSLAGRLPRFRLDGRATVAGRPAIVLRGADGSTVDVAAQGQPYPLRVVAPGGAGAVRFSDWDHVARPAAPPAADVINLNQLRAGAS